MPTRCDEPRSQRGRGTHFGFPHSHGARSPVKASRARRVFIHSRPSPLPGFSLQTQPASQPPLLPVTDPKRPPSCRNPPPQRPRLPRPGRLNASASAPPAARRSASRLPSPRPATRPPGSRAAHSSPNGCDNSSHTTTENDLPASTELPAPHPAPPYIVIGGASPMDPSAETPRRDYFSHTACRPERKLVPPFPKSSKSPSRYVYLSRMGCRLNRLSRGPPSLAPARRDQRVC